MTVHVARNDAVIRQQVTTLTPTATNNATYKVKMNTKVSRTYTADASAAVSEITAGIVALLDANADSVPEFDEVTWTDSTTLVTVTGAATGEPFTALDGGGSAAFTPSTTVTPKSPNHWIAENFDSGTLPANGDTVVLTQLSSSQSFYWGLDQSGVTLAALDIRADSEAKIGLPEFHESGYYQATYRDTHLQISATLLEIGKGSGNGAVQIKIDLGSNACAAIIYRTSTNRADQDEAPVHIAGSHASNAMTIFTGIVDIAMLPGYTSQWATITISGGQLRCGAGVTLATLNVAGESSVETRSAITTLNTQGSGQVTHYAGNIGTADIQGGSLSIRASAALTITQLNGYGGRTLDLSGCSAAVTITDMDIYATPDDRFTIIDPNNVLVMTNPANTPNGAQSLVITTGSGRTVQVA